jgi:hypothetical protein
MRKSPEELEAIKARELEDSHPEHVPLIPYDADIERQKTEVREMAKKMREEYGTPEPIIITKNGDVKKASQLTLQEQEDEFIRCATNPIYFIETYLTIFDQTQGEDGLIVPFKLFPFQKFVIEEYLSHKFNIANKYRQAGITTTTCAYIAWYVMFNKNRGVAIVANKVETARDEFMADVVDFIENCPEWLRPKPDKKDTQKLKIYDNNSKLGAFSAKGGLRGYTPTLLFWDETAWTEKGDKFWEASGPTLQTGGRAIFVSTPSGLDAVFYKTFMLAKTKENNFNAIELYWFNDPRYNVGLSWVKSKNKENEIRLVDEGWDEKKRIKMMEDGWEATSPWFEIQIRQANGDMRKVAQELLGSFLGSGDNFIAEEFLRRIEENEILPPIRQEYTDREMWIWEDVNALENYIMAIDASAGHGEDNSTINILKLNEIIEEKIIRKNGIDKKVKIKRHKVEQVAEYYAKLTPQQLAEVAYQFGRRYNNAYTVVDITGGYGVQTIEKLLEFGYENIHYSEITHKPTRDRLQGYIKKGNKTMADGSVINVDLIPGFFIGNNRASVLLELQRAIHLEDIIVRSIRLLNELKTFVNVAGSRVADHKRSFHDDSIMGVAIGLFTLNFDMKRFMDSAGRSKKMIEAMVNINNPEIMKRRQLDAKNVPRTSPSSSFNLNPYITNAWMFENLKKK